MLNTITIPVDIRSLHVTAAGTVRTRTRVAYVNGEATDEALTDEQTGLPILRLSGVIAAINGEYLEGAVIDTTTDLTDTPVGTHLLPAGRCEMRLRADARSSFGGSYRGVLLPTLFIESFKTAATTKEHTK